MRMIIKKRKIKSNTQKKINFDMEEKDLKNLQDKEDKKLNLNIFPLKMKLRETLELHKSTVHSLCLLQDGRIASCSGDNTIKIINTETLKVEVIIRIKTWGILYISLLDNGDLVSSLGDNTIKIWKIEKNNYKSVFTLEGHDLAVVKTIQISKERLASCSNDKTIKIWKSVFPYKCINTLEGHTNYVYSLIELKNQNYLVSAGEDKTLRFWDTTTFKNTKTVNKISCWYRNGMIATKNHKLIIGGRGALTIFNSTNLQFETQIMFETKLGVICSILELDNGMLFCGTYNGMFVEIETIEYKNISLQKGVHDGGVTGMVIIGKTIFTCSQDKTIKVWEF